MIIKKTDRWIPYIFGCVIFFMTFYGVNFWPYGAILRYGAMVIGVALLFFLDKKFLETNVFACFILYALVVYLNFMAGDSLFDKSKNLLVNGSALFVSLSMTHYALQRQEKKTIQAIVASTVVVILWTAIATGVIDSTMPGVVRFALQQIVIGEDVSQFAAFYSVGMSNYILPHALPIMIPPFVMLVRNGDLGKLKRIISAAIVFAIIALIYFSGASGPLLVGVLILILSFVVHQGKLSSNIAKIIILSLITLPFLANDDLMLSLLNWLDGLIEGEGYFHNKIVAFQETITMGEAQGDVGERGDLYLKGVEAFLSNIFIGTQENVGGHSALLNRLASLGIVGFLPFLFMLSSHFKSVVGKIGTSGRIYYYLGLLAAFLMLAMKGIATWEIWFASLTFLPISILWFSSIKVNRAK